MKSLTKKIVSLFICSFLFFSVTQAALLKPDKSDEVGNQISNAAFDGGYNVSSNDFDSMLVIVVRAILSVLGMIFLILIFIAGNSWAQAAGSEEKVQKAKDTIRNLLIGLALVLIAYALSAGFGGFLSGALLK